MGFGLRLAAYGTVKPLYPDDDDDDDDDFDIIIPLFAMQISTANDSLLPGAVLELVLEEDFTLAICNKSLSTQTKSEEVVQSPL